MDTRDGAIAAAIHETAVIDPGVRLGADVNVGPYAVIGPGVTIGAGCTIGPHVVIVRDTTLGDDCQIHSSAVIGGDPQDLKYAGEHTQLVVGERTVVREFVTLNRGTAARGVTRIGRDCLLMAYSHVAHDCEIGDHVVIANSVAMGGHVTIEEWAIIGGLTAIHQFVRVGAHTMVSGATALRKDVPPFVKAAGNPSRLYGLNSVGLERRGFPEPVRAALKKVYRLFFHSDLNVSQALSEARATVEPIPEVLHFLEFVAGSERGITLR
ncbi:MAG: acyl-ACP--UDP-N-acetylglucosamine O-acyltransferase [Gemmatimonadetes bacterium]|nr:acyl-ACP--UDP-N-acetylglucosamine O-acyltransferase [Gemmatimonadota bacterium]